MQGQEGTLVSGSWVQSWDQPSPPSSPSIPTRGSAACIAGLECRDQVLPVSNSAECLSHFKNSADFSDLLEKVQHHTNPSLAFYKASWNISLEYFYLTTQMLLSFFLFL